jgi:hypothetical protein
MSAEDVLREVEETIFSVAKGIRSSGSAGVSRIEAFGRLVGNYRRLMLSLEDEEQEGCFYPEEWI